MIRRQDVFSLTINVLNFSLCGRQITLFTCLFNNLALKQFWREDNSLFTCFFFFVDMSQSFEEDAIEHFLTKLVFKLVQNANGRGF